jgi:Uma2 family endonuclease
MAEVASSVAAVSAPAEEMGIVVPTDGLTLAAPLVLHLPDSLQMTADQFFDFCQQNETLRIERTAEGDIILMPPAGPPSGARNADLNYQLVGWAKKDGNGIAFDSSAGFTLPSGAERSPDASWIRKERLASLTPEQRQGFWPICPDFVAEIRSPSDRLATLQVKMQEYLDNGAQLGWLLDPEPRHVYIYRPGHPVEQLDNPATVPGDPVLPGFVLDAHSVFDISF